VSAKFHSHHLHQHGEHHGHSHEHGHSGPEHLDGHTPQSIIDTVAHIGGMSKPTLKNAFNSTGLLGNISVEQVFSHEKEGTEFAFVLASGVRI